MTDHSDETGLSEQTGHLEETTERPALTYEQARTELQAVVSKLESGGASLDETLALWERGETLAATCQRFLDGAAERVERARAEHTSAPE